MGPSIDCFCRSQQTPMYCFLKQIVREASLEFLYKCNIIITFVFLSNSPYNEDVLNKSTLGRKTGFESDDSFEETPKKWLSIFYKKHIICSIDWSSVDFSVCISNRVKISFSIFCNFVSKYYCSWITNLFHPFVLSE